MLGLSLISSRALRDLRAALTEAQACHQGALAAARGLSDVARRMREERDAAEARAAVADRSAESLRAELDRVRELAAEDACRADGTIARQREQVDRLSAELLDALREIRELTTP